MWMPERSRGARTRACRVHTRVNAWRCETSYQCMGPVDFTRDTHRAGSKHRPVPRRQPLLNGIRPAHRTGPLARRLSANSRQLAKHPAAIVLRPRSNCRIISRSVWPVITPPSPRSSPPMWTPKSVGSCGANRATPMFCGPCCALLWRRAPGPRTASQSAPFAASAGTTASSGARSLAGSDACWNSATPPPPKRRRPPSKSEIDREQAAFRCSGRRARR